MNDPYMIPYDPLQQPPKRSRKRPGLSAYRFEEVPLSILIAGVVVILPLYFFGFVRFIAPMFLPQLLKLLGITDELAANALLNLTFEGTLFLILVVMLGGLLKQSFADLKKHGFGNFFRWTVLCYFAFMGVNIATSLITMLFTGEMADPQNQEAVIELVSVSPVIMFLTAAILGPIVEELIFRGIIFRTIRPLGKIPAILISAIAFGFAHVSAYVFAGDFRELLNIFPYLGMGLSFGIIYELRKNMLLNMLIHIIQNTLSILLILLLSESTWIESLRTIVPRIVLLFGK